MNFFENLQPIPPDPIFGLLAQFASDPRKHKVNLGAGVYKTEDLNPYVFESVKKAEKELLEREKSKDYLPIDGEKGFIQKTEELIFGKLKNSECLYGAQTVGGTSALKIGALLLKEGGEKKIYIPEPTWDNHRRIFASSGFEVEAYPYYNEKKRGFDCQKMVHFLEKRARSVILLHGCCHNPTGSDPTFEEWQKILEILTKKEHFPFFDFAYQGFGESIEKDADSIRLFAKQEMPFAVAVSSAKSFGIYAERCGAFFVGCKDGSQKKILESHIKTFIRSNYSNPPCHGARIVETILKDKSLKKTWENELNAVRERISKMRKLFCTLLQKKTSRSFAFILSQKGMFSYLGLESPIVDRLISEYAIYMTKDGRINVAGLNTENVEYVTDSLAALFK